MHVFLKCTLNLPLNKSRTFFQNPIASFIANEINYKNVWGGFTKGEEGKGNATEKYFHL